MKIAMRVLVFVTLLVLGTCANAADHFFQLAPVHGQNRRGGKHSNVLRIYRW